VHEQRKWCLAANEQLDVTAGASNELMCPVG
jgi:hypothetical protein